MQFLQQMICGTFCFLDRVGGSKHNKFVAANTANNGIGRRGCAEATTNFDKKSISQRMSEIVVDALELIQVQEQQYSVFSIVVEAFSQAALQKEAVAQPGQGVLKDSLFQLSMRGVPGDLTSVCPQCKKAKCERDADSTWKGSANRQVDGEPDGKQRKQSGAQPLHIAQRRDHPAPSAEAPGADSMRQDQAGKEGERNRPDQVNRAALGVAATVKLVPGHAHRSIHG